MPDSVLAGTPTDGRASGDVEAAEEEGGAGEAEAWLGAGEPLCESGELVQ